MTLIIIVSKHFIAAEKYAIVFFKCYTYCLMASYNSIVLVMGYLCVAKSLISYKSRLKSSDGKQCTKPVDMM